MATQFTTKKIIRYYGSPGPTELLGKSSHCPSKGETILNERYKSWKRQAPLYYRKVTNKQFEYHIKLVYHQLGSEVAQGIIAQKEMPDNPHFYCANFREGYLHIVAKDALDKEQEQIMVRFTRVFSQTYARFLDLQKAEALAREAEIELALERVRSKTMAMHNSVDVDITVTTLFNELLSLGVDKSIRSGIGILDYTRKMEVWTASTNDSSQTLLDKGILDMGIHSLLSEIQNAWEAKKSTYTYELVGEDLINYFKAINDSPDYSLQVDFKKLPGKIIHYDFFFPEGVLFAFSPTPISEELNAVFKRFAGVFGQTYTRFLDLQKAEVQVREAQIEASLERVRSCSMGYAKKR
ncbi:MAG: hypothetical protein U5K79_01645 [Cyclobacteriaceae bacterium]|nr:hypothetical protein [Cyclobacteriaceae bacterium]